MWRRTVAAMLIILGSSLVLFDVSLYVSSVEMLGLAVLVLGFGLLSMDNREYIMRSFAVCVGIFFISLAVDYAFAQRAPQDGVIVPFGEYLGNSLDYLTVIALVLSFVVPFIITRARGFGKKM